jgi:hypothetical protein
VGRIWSAKGVLNAKVNFLSLIIDMKIVTQKEIMVKAFVI